jgi:type II secretion system protein H
MKIVNCKLKIAKRSGFTLIELMVVMAIIGILAATAMVNFGKNADRDVRSEKDRLTSFLREVQNKALTAEKEGLTPTGKICGFGVHFRDSSTIQIYYVETNDLDVGCEEDASKTNSSNAYSTAALFPGGSFIFKNSVTADEALPLPDDIFFMAPNGEIYYGGNKVSVSVPPMNLTQGSSGVSIPIKIEQSGRIH